jgi:signal recognition particle receptor subunit beta
VGAVSDTHPITVEAATDFGRITLHADLVLYLFGTSEPGQAGFAGALGAVVLVDPRRIEDAFAAINYFENGSGVPFVVAVNMFDGGLAHDLDELREALALDPTVPLMTCDARDPRSAATVLQELVSYTLNVGP